MSSIEESPAYLAVKADSQARIEASRRLIAKFQCGSAALTLIEAVVDAACKRKDWLEGGVFAQIYADTPGRVAQRLAELPELEPQDVIDAWALYDDAVIEVQQLASGLRLRACELSMPPEQPLDEHAALRGLRRLSIRRADIDDDERRYIRAARAAGVRWEDIGAALGLAPGRQHAYRRARSLGLHDLFVKAVGGEPADSREQQ